MHSQNRLSQFLQLLEALLPFFFVFVLLLGLFILRLRVVFIVVWQFQL
jgi:hypothetical protein